MNYASIEDLMGRLGTDFLAIYPAGHDADARSDLEAAEAEINGAAGKRYRVPISDPPLLPMLKDWTLILCAASAYGRAASSRLPEKLRDRVAVVREYLGMIRRNEFVLYGAEENSSAGPRGLDALYRCEHPVYSRRDMRNF